MIIIQILINIEITHLSPLQISHPKVISIPIGIRHKTAKNMFTKAQAVLASDEK